MCCKKELRPVAKRYQVTLTIEGLHSHGGNPDLDAFVAAVRDFRDTLRAVEKDLTRDKLALDVRVVNFTHSSPATVTVEAFARPGSADVREQWLTHVNETLRSVISLTDVDTLPIPVLKKVRQLSHNIGTKIAALRIAANEEVISFNLDTYQSANRVLNDILEYETSASGTLDTIDFHAGINRFVIYPTHRRPVKIACSFPPHLADQAHAAVRQRVVVTGKGRFRHGTHTPVMILANRLQVLPSDSDLPALNDLRGMEPGITGDVSSEEFVRERRNAWA